MQQIVAFSGGKDSTAMALRMAELGESASLFFTPAGNEPPELFAHVDRMVELLGWSLIQPKAPTLLQLIDEFQALPNWRQRWCTRMIKIQPCIAYLKTHPGSVLCVGLRADEEEREGLYGDYAAYRYPLREYGWSVRDVRHYLFGRGVDVPVRTDCLLCYGQRLSEWYALWRDRPEEYARGEALEERLGYTFRSPGRDTWPASLRELRAEFERGRRPRGMKDQPELKACRVCRF